MERTIEFAPSAKREIDRQVACYEDKAEGLGQRFRMEVDRHIAALRTVPFMQTRYDGIRCVPVSGFPYMVHYSCIEERNVIRVHAIIHTSRNPLSNWNDMGWIVSEDLRVYGVHAYDLEYYYAA